MSAIVASQWKYASLLISTQCLRFVDVSSFGDCCETLSYLHAFAAAPGRPCIPKNGGVDGVRVPQHRQPLGVQYDHEFRVSNGCPRIWTFCQATEGHCFLWNQTLFLSWPVRENCDTFSIPSDGLRIVCAFAGTQTDAGTHELLWTGTILLHRSTVFRAQNILTLRWHTKSHTLSNWKSVFTHPTQFTTTSVNILNYVVLLSVRKFFQNLRTEVAESYSSFAEADS